MLVNLKQNSQVTVPKAIIDKLRLKTGDKLDVILKDGEIRIKPVLIIDRSQAWYWSKEWQDKIKEANEDLKAGRVYTADSVDELFSDCEVSDK